MDTATQALELDSAAIAKTKSQISGLVSEIATLSQSHRDPKSFAQDMLPRLTQSMAASGAALWSVNSEGLWHAISSYGMPRELIDDIASTEFNTSVSPESSIDRSLDSLQLLIDGHSDQEEKLGISPSRPTDENTVNRIRKDNSQGLSPSRIHQVLLKKVQQERQPVLVPPGNSSATDRNDESGSPDATQPINPTKFALVFAPVPVDPELGTWWLQVVQPPRGGVATQRGYLRFVAQIADLTADFLKTHRLREHQYQTRLANATTRLLDTVVKLPSRSNPTETLIAMISSIREMLECDQVFLVQRQSHRSPWQLTIASGMRAASPKSDGSLSVSRTANWFVNQAIENTNRSMPITNLAEDRRLRKKSDESPCIVTRIFNSEVSQGKENKRIANSTDDAILRFNAMFTAAVSSWIPLFSSDSKNQTGVGLLVYWSWPTPRPSEHHLDKLLLQCQSTSIVVLRAVRPASLAYWTGSASLPGRRIRSILAAFANSKITQSLLAISVLIALSFIPIQLHLTSPATIIAANMNRYYARSDSSVRSILVDYGQTVAKGQLLIELEDKNLRNLLDQTRAEMRQLEQKESNLNSRLLRDQQLPESTRRALEGELATIRKISPQTAVRLNDLLEQEDALKIRAQSDGVITTWNLKQSLKDRPVKTGQLLVSVQSNDSPWMVEARMPQHRAGQFLELVSSDSNTKTPLNAVCTLVSNPGKDIPAVFRTDERSSIVAFGADSVHDSIFRVRFAIPNIKDSSITSGSAASLRIDAGRGPIWKALIGDAIEGAWAKWRLWTGL